MTCADVRLDEYLDGELDEGVRAAVEGHLASCALCRADLEKSRRLESLLQKSVPSGAAPDTDRFLQGVQSRSRSRGGWGLGLAAAALLGVLSIVFSALRSGPVDVREQLVLYSQKKDMDGAEARIRSAGPAAFAVLEKALEDSDVALRVAAATLLSRCADPASLDAILARRGGPVDIRVELSRYSHKGEKDGAEVRLRLAGARSLPEVEKALEDSDVKIQAAAAAYLIKVADESTRERVLARFQPKGEKAGGWNLMPVGLEEDDTEIIPVAVSLAVDGQERWAMDVLKRMNRLDRLARGKVVESVVTLLHSTNTKVQKLALDIVKELEIEFPLPAIVELLDSADLGDEALRILRQATKQDFGKDKEAWKKAVEHEEEL